MVDIKINCPVWLLFWHHTGGWSFWLTFTGTRNSWLWSARSGQRKTAKWVSESSTILNNLQATYYNSFVNKCKYLRNIRGGDVRRAKVCQKCQTSQRVSEVSDQPKCVRYIRPAWRKNGNVWYETQSGLGNIPALIF